MPAARFLTVLMRLSGALALFVGIAMWLGFAASWLPIHILLGVTLILGMWGIAVLAFREGTRRGYGVLVFLWGLGIVVLGGTQARLIPGPMHWLVKLAHLVVGPVGAALGAVLGKAIERSRAQGIRSDSGPSIRSAA